MALSARLLSCMPVASYMPSSFVRSPAQLRLRLRALSFCYLGSSKSLRLSHHHRHRQIRAMSNRPINGEASDSDAADSTPRIVLDVSSSSSIVPVELHKEATDSYLSYALSVLFGRALPDVRDGLKPVHRRIIFAMHELGLSSKRPYKKCARIVGEVLGKFHPHGDSAVYASLVRMAQDFSLRSPLVSGHGNFGSLDADPPAAMRYTECRLQALSEAMLLADLEQNTVDFVSNFDGSQQEPALLPARLPNILLNGASGIAVGMATSIPPHNLGEVADALIAFINNPDATVQELMEYIRGPDFPTGGKILGIDGILEAYRTGRGSVLVRGTTEVELLDNRSNKSAIIIREIPYQTNKAAFVSRIAELIDNKVIDGITDVRDESDRLGMRVVLELKRGGDPSIVLNNIYKHTSLQTAFNCNIVGIINGQPKVMSLTDILKSFVEFRVSVVSRRATFQLKTAEEREHIVKGILTGLDNIDDVVNIIRKSGSHQDALKRLKEEFTLSEKQGSALLEMSLKRLTLLERNRYAEEQKVLHGKIENLRELLADRKKILQVIVKEAVELKEKFNTPRRSVIEENEKAELDDLDMIPNEEMLLALSEKGYIKRMKPDHFSAQHRGTVGKSLGKLREHDAMSEFIICRAHDHILYFSDKGIVYSARAFRVPECSRTASGTPLVQVLALSSGERVTSIIPVSEFSENQYLIMLTAKAYIKRVSLGLFSSMRSTGIIAIQLVPGDQLRWVRQCSDKDLIAVGSRMGYLLLSSCGKVRALSRTSRGVRSMRLKGEDTVASMDIVPSTVQQELQKDLLSLSSLENSVRTPWLLFVTENGYGKRVPLNQFKVLPLNRVGLVAYKLMPDDGVAGLFVAGLSRSDDGESDEQVVLVSQSGTLNRIKVRDISIQSRYARGVILMRLEYGGKIQSVSLISSSEAEKETAEI